MTFRQTVHFLLVATGSVFSFSCVKSTALKPPEVVDKVDLHRYLGTWYDIAHLPFKYQRNCYSTTATYEFRPDGRISVINRCRKGAFDGRESRADGIARVVESKTGAKLEVSFFRPFWADYWVLGIDPDYRWALVGTPDYRYLWILSRYPTMAGHLFQEIVDRAAALGFDTGRLEKTPQRDGP